MTNKMKVPFNKPFIAGKELYYISQAVNNAHLSGDGPFTKRCHAWLENTLGCKRALLTQSCTSALEMAAILADIKPGDEIIMPSFTFVSTANAFVLRGGIPVFVDIRPDTLNIDERLIETAITERTRAVVPVHYAGVSCEMNAILDIARKHNLLVIEDAAQALLSKYKGKHLGTIGHLGCLSFHETKNIISGEGGALLVNDEHLTERAEVIREKGTNRNKFFRGLVDKYTWVDIGSSYLPSELIGAFLYAQLEQSEKIIETRRALFQRYYSSLRPLEDKSCLRLPYVQNDCACNGHIFYVITHSYKERAALLQYLNKNDVNAVFHYIPLHSSPAGMKYGKTRGNMKITDEMSGKILRLPMYYEMNAADVDTVVNLIYTFYGQTG